MKIVGRKNYYLIKINLDKWLYIMYNSNYKLLKGRQNIMYIHRIIKKIKNKQYKSVLLQRSYRDKIKGPRQETIATLTDWPEKLVDDFEKLLKGGSVVEAKDLSQIMETEQGKSIGLIKVVNDLCYRLGLNRAISEKRMCLLVKVMIAGFLSSGKFSKNFIANEWSKLHALKEVFGNQPYWNEDDLYQTLAWLNKNQRSIEKKLFKHKYGKNLSDKTMFLYDVTGSYVEGEKIALSSFGYQRDGKPGKKQIVIGMMADIEGDPICIEVFQGNTLDHKTVESQLKKIKNEYELEKVIFVGDRGMIKSQQIESITNNNWEYITGITKPQIEKLIKDDIIQYSLFDEELCEVKYEDIRYILKRNPFRADEIKNNFNDKINKFENLLNEKNKYLLEHKKASVETAKKYLEDFCKKRKLKNAINITVKDRTFSFSKNEDKITEILKLAGCYVLKTNISEKNLSKEKVHTGYKNLSLIEHGFKRIKTALINLRPFFVRKEEHIRGHVFACMLALKIVLYMENKLKPLDFTFEYCLESLTAIHTINYSLKNQSFCRLPDKFSEDNRKILKKLNLHWKKDL